MGKYTRQHRLRDGAQETGVKLTHLPCRPQAQAFRQRHDFKGLQVLSRHAVRRQQRLQVLQLEAAVQQLRRRHRTRTPDRAAMFSRAADATARRDSGARTFSKRKKASSARRTSAMRPA